MENKNSQNNLERRNDSQTMWENVVKTVINHREKIYNPNVGKTFQNMITKRNQNTTPEPSKKLLVNPTT